MPSNFTCSVDPIPICVLNQGIRLRNLPRPGTVRCPMGEIMSKSLFDKYGGFSTVSKIVLTLYDRLLDDDDRGSEG